MIGILKAFLGLSASAYVTLYVSFLDPDATAFVLMLAILPALLCLLCASFINYVRARAPLRRVAVSTRSPKLPHGVPCLCCPARVGLTHDSCSPCIAL